jgi:hypothetical protein
MSNHARASALTPRVPRLASQVLAVLAIAAFGCTPNKRIPPHEIVQSVAGCYELERGPWLVDSTVVDGLWTSRAPRRFRLSSNPVAHAAGQPDAGVPPQFEARSLDSADHAAGWLQAWTQHPPGAAQIIVNRPLSPGGYSYTFQIEGNRLVGEMRVSTDAAERGRPSEASRPVSAVRIDCPQV